MPKRIELDDIEARLETLELLMHRVLLIVGAAGNMLSPARQTGRGCIPRVGRHLDRAGVAETRLYPV
jgi:hypothetical protein